MRGCDPASAAARLELAMESFQKAKLQALLQWEDEMSRGFDERYLIPLEPKVRRALDAIRHLADALARAERDCS